MAFLSFFFFFFLFFFLFFSPFFYLFLLFFVNRRLSYLTWIKQFFCMTIIILTVKPVDFFSISREGKCQREMNACPNLVLLRQKSINGFCSIHAASFFLLNLNLA